MHLIMLSHRMLPLLFLIACAARGTSPLPAGPATSGEAPAATVTPSTGDFALLWSDTVFYRDQGQTPVGQAYDYGSDGRLAHSGELYLVEVLQAQGDWLQVALGIEVDWSLHCASSTPFSSAWNLALWVRADDAAPVLIEAFSRQFEDGTSVDLRPGTPLVDGQPWVDGLLLPVEVPEASRGRTYRAAEPSAPSGPGGSRVLLPEGSAALLNAQSTALMRAPWTYSDGVYVNLRREEDQWWFARADGCGSVWAQLDPGVEIPEDDPIGGGMSGMIVPPRTIAIASGTPVLWRDGTPAGVLRRDVYQTGRSPGEASLHCTPLDLGIQWRSPGWQDTQLELCVDAAHARGTGAGAD